MNVILKAGIVFGAAIGVLMLINGFAGLYKDPAMTSIFPWLATLIELGVLVWALLQTKSAKRYWGQVGTGTAVTATGGVLIVMIALIYTMALFPDYQEVALQQTADKLADSGLSDDMIDQQLKVTEFMLKPVPNAILGYVITVFIGFVGSLIIAAFVRKKD